MTRTLKILVVDDDPDVAESLADILRSDTREVVVALSGEDALNIFQRRPFDVVLMDVAMPGMNGVETLVRMRSVSIEPRFVLMTGYCSTPLKNEALQRGASEVLDKPLDIDRFLRIAELPAPGAAILIVEDDADFAASLSDILTSKGYSVHIAVTAESALRRINENGFRVVVLDLALPDMPGTAVFEKTRHLERKFATFVVSAFDLLLDPFSERHPEDAATAIFSKPIDMPRFLSKLREKVGPSVSNG